MELLLLKALFDSILRLFYRATMVQRRKRFSYYKSLTAVQKKIYDKSDAIVWVKFEEAGRFKSAMRMLEDALLRDDKTAVAKAAQRVIYGLCTVFGVPQIKVKVLAKRPSNSSGEMHGLYEYEEESKKSPVITVWMRTAQRKQVVAFKTFLRTIIHEFMHHLDFHLLKFEDSLHTEGFYMRENSLVKKLISQIK